MESLWRKQTGQIVPKLTEANTENSHYDVIVVGAGMAGLLTAYYLQEQGKKVLVLEAAEIASGQTERTTAKITSQHALKYTKLIKEVGAKKARLYARANEEAIKEYERLIQREQIDCRLERVPAYLYTTKDAEVLIEEAKAASYLGIDAFFTTETELPFAVKGAVCFRNQAQFSPLEFVQQIAGKLEVWEHAKVIKVRGHQVLVKKTEKEMLLNAENIVIATHYPMINVPGFYFLRQHQERSYVLALSGCEKHSGVDGDNGNNRNNGNNGKNENCENKAMKGMYYGIDKDGHSFRRAGELLLLGGSSCRTGKNTCGGAFDALRQAAKKYYPECEEEFHWAAQDCMPHDGIPFIGKYSIFTPHLYVATGFQKWGMTSSMIAALLLRDEICGVENPYRKLFTPQRSNCRAGIVSLLYDIGVSAKGLTLGLFGRPRCSHMGCKLKWNPEEKSWDCPCHGSRYDNDGKLLDNPSKKDAHIKAPK